MRQREGAEVMDQIMKERVDLLEQWIRESDNVVFFGGAGVSTESGIPDFRSVDGLYNQQYDYPPETIISHSFFVRNPEEFYRFYRKKLLCPDAKPNAAHKKLAELEATGKLNAVVTQNIDGLHQMAGSHEVLELHGSVLRNYCERCGKFYGVDAILHSTGVPKCSCGGDIKPDVVLYDVLGDVVCGGFAMPIREGYANEVFIVSSGEMMALYAASNIAQAIRNFGRRGYARLCGIILNARNIADEQAIVRKAADEIGTQIVACIPRNGDIQRAEARGGTVFECLAESPMHAVYNDLADRVLDMTQDEKGEQQVC